MEPKQYCRLSFVIAVVALGIVAIFNLLVDPLGAYRPVSAQAFEPLRATLFTRTARGELARRGPWDAIVLGTSRPKAGLPARHPVFATNRVCNLAVDAARMSEAAAIVDYTRARQPLRRVVLFLDFAMFRASTFYKYDFADSRFNPELSLFEYHCKNLIGADATERSWKFTSKLLRGFTPPEGETNGFYVHSLRAKTAQRELFERVLRTHAYAYSAMRSAHEQMEELRRVLRSCRDHNIELTLALNPVHALDLELWRAGENWERFEQWKRDLMAVVAEEGVAQRFAVWDFSGYSEFTTEEVPPPGDATARMKFYFENSHYTPALGALMLDRMLATATNDFGVKISPANIEDHLQLIRNQRENYASTHADEVQWVQRISKQALAARKKSTDAEEVE
jgi:hypothetical protein